MKIRNRLAFVVAMFSWVFVVFFGCASTVPITDSMIQEVGGIENTPLFQYYVSKTITLTLLSEDSATTIESGQLIRRSSTDRETIIIRGSLPGLVRDHFQTETIDGTRTSAVLSVAFENYEGNPSIPFMRINYIDERYYILAPRKPYYMATPDMP